MSEKSLLIVNAVLNPAEKTAATYYTDHVRPLLQQAGGKPVGRYQIQDRLFGNQESNLVVVMEFPNSQAIKEVFASEAYQALIPYREKAFHDLNIFIAN